jgi:hypothetical protein
MQKLTKVERYKAKHMTLEQWQRYISNLDRRDRAKRALYREREQKLRDRLSGHQDRLRWHSRPDRNCPAWVQELQRMTAEQLIRWVEQKNDITTSA